MQITEARVTELMKENFMTLVESNKDFFFKLFFEFTNEIIEDKGMLAALNEVSEKDCQEADSKELEAIFNGEFIIEN